MSHFSKKNAQPYVIESAEHEYMVFSSWIAVLKKLSYLNYRGFSLYNFPIFYMKYFLINFIKQKVAKQPHIQNAQPYAIEVSEQEYPGLGFLLFSPKKFSFYLNYFSL